MKTANNITGIRAIAEIKHSYWLIDLEAEEPSLELSKPALGEHIINSSELLVFSDAYSLLESLTIMPSPSIKLLCLNTIKALVSKNKSPISLPDFSDDGEAKTWFKQALLLGLAKIKSLNMSVLLKLECQTILASLAMQKQGLPFVISRWQAELSRLDGEAQILKARLQDMLSSNSGFELFGPKLLDLNNHNEVKTCLEKLLGITLASTSESSLKNIKHEAVELLISYREHERLLSTFGTNFLNNIKNNRLRGHFSPLGCASGRFACSNTNLQALPSNNIFRSCIDPGVGRALLSFDFGAFELRILASLSKDARLLQIFAQKLDIHSMVASAVFNTQVNKTTNSHLRDQAKILNFGIIYGMGEHALAAKLNISRQRAEDILNNYFKNFQRVKAFLLELETSAQNKGYCQTTLGRRQYLSYTGHNMRVARNMPIQGTGADILKLAMCKVFKSLNHSCLDAYLVNSIHDELVIECQAGEQEQVSNLVKQCMSQALSAILPDIEADVSVSAVCLDK